MRRLVSGWAIGVAAVAVAACGSSSASTEPTASPSYSVSIRGDQQSSLKGISLTQVIPDGYGESIDGGSTSTIPVVLLSFADLDLTKPQVNLGLLGALTTGTYRVRAVGSSPLGSKPEFYGSYALANPDGSRRDYTATDGTVTITSVSPVIRGSFSFHSARSSLWPAGLATGTRVNSEPASLDASGTFVARAP